MPLDDELVDDVPHVPGREELALLDVDDLAGLGRGDEEIGLPAEEGRDLEDVDDRRDDRALLALVDVGEDRHAELAPEIGEDRQRRVEPHAALAGETGAVRLVEGGLVDEADAEAGRHLLEPAGDVEGMRAEFELARAGDERERKVVAEDGFADRDVGVGLHGGGTIAARIGTGDSGDRGQSVPTRPSKARAVDHG